MIVSGPTSGDTLVEYQWFGGTVFGSPPFTFDWDFDYDGEHFDEDVQNVQNPTWTYNVAGAYNQPRDYTVALRVTDGHENQDIDTQVITITPTYALEILEIDGPRFPDLDAPVTFTVKVKNTGTVRSPSYVLDAKIWWKWEILEDFDDEESEGLIPYGPPNYRKDTFYFLYVTEEIGYQEFWAIIKVDGVILDEGSRWFRVTNW
jgi:hypothetical protein